VLFDEGRAGVCCVAGSGRLEAVKRVLSLMLAAGVVVWVAALFDFQFQRETRHPGTEPSVPELEATPDLPPQPAPLPVVGSSRTRDVDQPVQPVSSPRSLSPSGVREPARSPAAHGPLQIIGKVARAFVTAARGSGTPREPEPEAPVKVPEGTGELGEGVLSPEYAELERHYVDEPRDGEWATAEEQRIRELFHGQELGDKLAIVNCQQTVCRIVLETGSNDGWKELLRVPGLAQETKLAAQSPYSLRSGQLSVYFHPQPQPN
jgi:hypothetical protein